jgi:hypothetical protein
MFKSTNGGVSWAPFNLATIPAVATFDVQQNNNGVVFVGTHGRGAYQLNSGAGPTPTATRTATKTPTRTATKTPTPKVPTKTPTRTATGVIVRTPTRTPTRTATGVIAKTPTRTPTRTATRTPTRTPTPKGPTPKATPTPVPTPKLLSHTYPINLAAPPVPGCVDSAAQALTGAVLGNVCTASMAVKMQAGQVLGCFVNAAGQVTFRVCQPSGVFPTDPDGAAGTTYRAVVAQ